LTEILLVGFGKMGGALLKGWIRNNVVSNVLILDPYIKEFPEKFSNFKYIRLYNNTNELPKNISPSMVVLAVKPQVMKEVLLELKFINVLKTCWLTVAAGLPIDFYENILGPKISIFRTIPNIPAEVSRGVTAIVRNKNCNQDQTLLAKNLLQSIGQLVELDDENLMDAVTAISGSGPAYFYYLIEAMTFSGVSIGLSKQNALKLAKETFLGAAALLDKSEEDVSSLRDAVTSPGGTTEAALKTFQKNNEYFKLVKKAIISARDRGVDLADQLK